MITPEFLADLEAFSLIIRKRITSKYSGGRTSSQAGRGITLKEHRQYAPGDDIRAIDWKVYARSDDLFVKIFEEDKDMSVHLIIDATKSMSYGSGIRKYDYASMIGAAFLSLTMRENERFRYTFIKDNLEIYPMKRGRAHFAQYVTIANDCKPDGASTLKEAISAYKPLIQGKSLIIIVSDFLFPQEEIEDVCRMLSRHEVKLIRVLDKDEMHLPFEGDMRLVDIESGQALRTYLSARERMEYEKALADHTAMIEKNARTLSFDYALATTSTPIFDTISELLKQ